MLKAPHHLAHEAPRSLFRPRTIRPSDTDPAVVIPTCWRLCRFFGRTKEVLDYGESLLDISRHHKRWYDYRPNGANAKSREATLLEDMPMMPTGITKEHELAAYSRATAEALSWLAVSIDQDTAEVLCAPHALQDIWPDPHTLIEYEHHLLSIYREEYDESLSDLVRRLRDSLDTQEINDIIEIFRNEDNKIDLGDMESNRSRVYLQLESSRKRAITQGNFNAELKAIAVQSTILGLTQHQPADEMTSIHNIIENYTPPALNPGKQEGDSHENPDD